MVCRDALWKLWMDEDWAEDSDWGRWGSCVGDEGTGVVEPPGLFFQGWKPLPTAASARGGGDLEVSLLHWAASMARGVVRGEPRSEG